MIENFRYDMYDDILYFDDNKIKETVMKQTFLINKGFFDPKSYFPSLNVTNLDDNAFDKKILGLIMLFYDFFNYFVILDMLNPPNTNVGKNIENNFKYHH